jgi:hypothetical protein
LLGVRKTVKEHTTLVIGSLSFGDSNMTLSQALASELDSSEKADLNADFQQKGINVRF